MYGWWSSRYVEVSRGGQLGKHCSDVVGGESGVGVVVDEGIEEH